MKKILISCLICICLLVVLLTAWQRVEEYYPWTKEWIDSIRTGGVLRDTFIVAEDGRRLHAYYLPRHPKHDTFSVARTAMLIHGYRNCAVDMMHLGYWRRKAGM